MFFLLFSLIFTTQPNPPKWPSSVIVNPTQKEIDHYYSMLGGNKDCCGVPDYHGHFSTERVAFLFENGYHNVDVKVGYYTSVLGLGGAEIKSLITHNDASDVAGALCNFWRSVERIKISTSTLYAVSQASPMRSVEINGDLSLSENGGYSSGGFLADMKISGNVYSGTQQQYFARNSDFSWWHDGQWNMVFQGCSVAPNEDCGRYNDIYDTPHIAEKPYIRKSGSKYSIVIPGLQKNLRGRDNSNDESTIAFEHVYVATSDDIDGLLSALANNDILSVVLTPGIYLLTETLVIYKDNFILFGMGMANLVAPPGQSAVLVTGNGVRVSGLLIEPEGKYAKNEPLVVVGHSGQKSGSETSPVGLYDIFTRVGRFRNAEQTSVDIQVQINMDWVFLDDVWLWRGDHDAYGPVAFGMNPSNIGLEVNGDNVHAYGVASEHNIKQQVKWSGNGGYVAFFQAEMPYDVSEYDVAAFEVSSHVKSFAGYGLGAYCFFRDHDVTAPYGFSTPNNQNVYMKNVFTIFLTGQGGIRHVINQEGNEVASWDYGPERVCGSAPPPEPGSCAAMIQKQACDQSGCYSCGDRINWLESSEGMTPAEAYQQVAKEFPTICICDNPPSQFLPRLMTQNRTFPVNVDRSLF